MIESHAMFDSIESLARAITLSLISLVRQYSFNLITRAFSKHLLFSRKHERDANNYVNALPVPFSSLSRRSHVIAPPMFRPRKLLPLRTASAAELRFLTAVSCVLKRKETMMDE
jgi:hypothetical protein